MIAPPAFERVLLLAPPDDEPETEEERALVEEGLRDIREGRVPLWAVLDADDEGSS